MNVCVGPLAAAIGTGISIELMDSDIVGGGSSSVEAVSSLASEGMHTRSPISRMVAELYGTAISRPLLMHTPPCLPTDEGSGQRESLRYGHRIHANRWLWTRQVKLVAVSFPKRRIALVSGSNSRMELLRHGMP